MKRTIKRCLLGLIASATMFSFVQAQDDESVGAVQLGPKAQVPPSPTSGDSEPQTTGPINPMIAQGGQPFASPGPMTNSPFAQPGSAAYRLTPVDQVFVPRFYVNSYGGGLYGYGSGYATLGAFVPYKLDNHSLLFASAMGVVTYDQKGGASVGFGWRHYMEELDRIAGLSMWFDFDNGHYQPYQQMGFSFESLGRFVDYRVNGYVPIGNPNHVLYSTVTPNPVLMGNTIGLLTYNSIEQSYSGFDAEVGGPTPILGRYGLNAYVGGYSFSGNGTHGGNFQGVSGRIQSQITEDVSFGVQVTDDHVFGLNTQFQVFVNLPNGRPSRWFRNLKVEDRLTQNVFRQYRVIAHTDNFQTYTTAINPNTDKPYYVAYINPNQTTNGSGSEQSPFNSVAAYEAVPLAQRQSYDIIFVQPRNDGTSTNLDTASTLDLYSGQRLLSTNISHTFTTLNLPGTTMTFPALAGSANPILDNTSGGNVITMVGNNAKGIEVSGFTINGSPTGNGIYGQNVLGANINNNTIQNGLNGVLFQNLSGTFALGTEAMIVSNTIKNNIGDGIEVNNNGTPPSSTLEVSVQNNNVSSNGSDGIQLIASGNASIGGLIGGANTSTVTNANVFNLNGANGLELDANGGVLNFLTTSTPPTGTPVFGIANNTFTQNTLDGLRISTTNNSVAAVDIIQNTTGSSTAGTLGNGNYGINLLSDSGVNLINIGGSTASVGNSFYGDMMGAINFGLTGTNLTTANIRNNTIVGNPGSSGSAILPGFNANTLAANDDLSTGLVPIGFTADFYGVNFNQLFVNNNGNVTLNQALAAFTPFPIVTNGIPMFAPFFADVDTRQGAVVSYGTGTVNGHKAFGVNWPNVEHFNATVSGLPTNNFQLVIIDRSDIAPGDFDFEYNYKQIQWEAGAASGANAAGLGGNSARVGWTNGSTASYEFAGSAVNGALLDSGPIATSLIHNSLNSNIPGQYIFEVRNGVVATNTIGSQNGISIDVANTAHLANSTILNNSISGVSGYGIEVTTHGTATADNLTISNNTITRDGTGIQLNRNDSSVLQVIMSSNAVTQSLFNGIEVNTAGTATGSTNVTSADDVLTNSTGNGLQLTSADASILNFMSTRLTSTGNQQNNVQIKTSGTAVSNVNMANTIATGATQNGLAATLGGTSILNLTLTSPSDPLFTAAATSQFNGNSLNGLLFNTSGSSFLNLQINDIVSNTNKSNGISFNRTAASLILGTISNSTSNSNSINGFSFVGLGGDPTDPTQQHVGTPNTINLNNDAFTANGNNTATLPIGDGAYVNLYGQTALVLNAQGTSFSNNVANGFRVDLNPGASFGYIAGGIASTFNNVTVAGNGVNGIMFTSESSNNPAGDANSETNFLLNSNNGASVISNNAANGIEAQYVAGLHNITIQGDGRTTPLYQTQINGNAADGILIQSGLFANTTLNMISGTGTTNDIFVNGNKGNGINFQAADMFSVKSSQDGTTTINKVFNTAGIATLNMDHVTVDNNTLNGVNLLGAGLSALQLQANAAGVQVPYQNNLNDASGTLNVNVSNSEINSNGLAGVNIEMLGRMSGNTLVFTNNTIDYNKNDGFYMEQNAGQQVRTAGGLLFRREQYINPPTTPGTAALNWLIFAATNPAAYNYGSNAPLSVGLLSNWMNLQVNQSSSLQMYGNKVQYNGTQPNITLGDGVHIRVGTDTYLSADIGGTAGSAALGNTMSGNVHTDFYVESFLSYNPATFVTPVPGPSSGTTSVNSASLTTLSTVFLDDTAQLDMRFNNNNGNSVTVIPATFIGLNGNVVPNSAVYPNDPVKDYNDFPGAPNSGLPRPVMLFQVDNSTSLDTTNTFVSGGATQSLVNTFFNNNWNLTTTPFILNDAAFPRTSTVSPGNPFLP